MVYRLDPDGGNPQAVFFTGGVVSAAGRAVGSTTGVDYGARLRHKCHEKVRSSWLPVESFWVCFISATKNISCERICTRVKLD